MVTGRRRSCTPSAIPDATGIIVTASCDSVLICDGRTTKPCGNSSPNLAGTGRGEKIALKIAVIRAALTRGDTV
jgi:hypothetical protein